MGACGQIICFERNLRLAAKIRNFLRKNWIFNCVVVNLQNYVDDYILEDGGFIFSENGEYLEKKGIAEEIMRLKGPIIIYGGHSKERRMIAISKPMKILNREDCFWVPEIFSTDFISAYWMIKINMIYKESRRTI